MHAKSIFYSIIIWPYLCRTIVVQSEEEEETSTATLSPDESSGASQQENSGVNLYILAGHEAMQL